MGTSLFNPYRVGWTVGALVPGVVPPVMHIEALQASVASSRRLSQFVALNCLGVASTFLGFVRGYQLSVGKQAWRA